MSKTVQNYSMPNLFCYLLISDKLDSYLAAHTCPVGQFPSMTSSSVHLRCEITGMWGARDVYLFFFFKNSSALIVVD